MASSGCCLELKRLSEEMVVTAISCMWCLRVNRASATKALERAFLTWFRTRSGVMVSGMGVPSLVIMRVLSCFGAAGALMEVVGAGGVLGEAFLEATGAQEFWGTAVGGGGG